MFTSTSRLLVAALAIGMAQSATAQVTISSVISSSQGPAVDMISPVQASRSDLSQLLGAPQNDDNQGPINFYSLGMGGEVTVEMSGPICNGPGNDLTVVETTWGFTCANYQEKARVWASQDLCNWVELTTEANPLCHNGDLDLGCLPWAKYLRIKDVSPANYAPDGDGYDIDGITGNTGCNLPTETGLARYAANGFLGNPQATQGLTENNTPVPAARDIQTRMLGLPMNVASIYANDVTTSAANNNFFSLGNGGSVTLSFPYSLFNGPGADVIIYETSFDDKLTRTCGNYPEKARIEGSCDGVTFYELTVLPGDAGNGEVAGSSIICRDGKLDFGSLPYVNYIRITDVTFVGLSNFPGNGDGYDVDAVFGLQNCSGIMPARLAEGADNGQDMLEDVLFVEAYPNPANEFINVSLMMKEAGAVQFNLTDLAGRVVLSRRISSDGVNMIQDLPLTGLNAGVYLLEVSANGVRETLRIVKN